MKFSLRALFLFLSIAFIQGNILRLSCKSVADFVVIHAGKRLLGHVLMRFNSLHDIECMGKCVENEICRSYNMNKQDGSCEINGKALVDNGTRLTTNADWIYKSTNYDTMLVGPVCKSLNPCSKHVPCKDTCRSPFFQCVHCGPYHEGINCDSRIDGNECASNPCKNLGACVDKLADYSCTCKPGYTGKNCEIDLDECWSLPCLNGGVCTNEIGSYSCKCPHAYGGKSCEFGKFHFVKDPTPWQKAREKCQEKYGDLASIESSQDKEIFNNTVNKHKFVGRFWVGLNDRKIENNFVWSDGTVFSNQLKWASNEPNGGLGENCTFLSIQSMELFDASCNIYIGYICKFP